MKIPSKVQWLDRSIVMAPCSIGLCRNEKSFMQEMKRLGVPRDQWPGTWLEDDKDGCTWEFIKDGYEHCLIVCIGPRGKASLDMWFGIFVHEAVHVWQKIREFIGEDNPGIELEAYAIQNITQGLFLAAGMK